MSSPEIEGSRAVDRAAVTAFRRAFEAEPVVGARAPGCVNLMGDGTDLAEGLILTVATEQEVRIAARARDDSRVRLFSADPEARAEFDAANVQVGEVGEVGSWAGYVAGVGWALRRAGHTVRGFDGAVAGNVPVDMGLGSSSALSTAAGVLFRAISELEIADFDLARLCREAETEFAGTTCRIADPLTAVAAQQGKALLIDCRDGTVTTVPFPPAARVILLDPGLRREEARAEPAARRAECEAVLARVREHDPEAVSLRDITPEELDHWASHLPATLAKRLRHVVGENERVRLAVSALEHNETERFGELLFASHRSLRDDYEASAPELDALVELAKGAPGVVGARATGRGARGCTVNVVAAAWVDEFIERVQHRYHERYGVRPEAYGTTPAAGASVLRLGRS